MKAFMFRCVKITIEEKTVFKADSEGKETTVHIQFEQANELIGPYLHGHAHVGLYLSDEQFKEFGYRVGQIYALTPT